MLTKLQAYSSWQSVPTLPLVAGGEENTDLLQIRDIQGLDPVKASVSTTPYGSVDGVSVTGRRVDYRNIVFKVHPNPDWDAWTNANLRRLLYRYFMPKQTVRLVFTSDDFPPVEIYGVVEDFQANSFSKDLEYQISIICPDPYFTAISSTTITGVTSDGSAHLHVTYNGDVEAGIRLDVDKVSGADPSRIDVRTRELYFSVFGGTGTSKRFSLNSTPGSKYVRNIDLTNGLITNLMNQVVEGSPWPILVPGLNDFTVVSTSPGGQTWSLVYYERFGGL